MYPGCFDDTIDPAFNSDTHGYLADWPACQGCDRRVDPEDGETVLAGGLAWCLYCAPGAALNLLGAVTTKAAPAAILALCATLAACAGDLPPVGLAEVPGSALPDAVAISADLDGDGVPNDEAWPLAALPVKYAVADTLDPAWLPYVEAALAAVQAAAPGLITVVPYDGDLRAHHQAWDEAPEGTVVIQGGTGNEARHAYTTVAWRGDCSIWRADVVLGAEVVADLPWGAHQAALQEVLHSLGLAHDAHQESVMWPVLTPDSTEFLPETQALLRRVYLERKE